SMSNPLRNSSMDTPPLLKVRGPAPLRGKPSPRMERSASFGRETCAIAHERTRRATSSMPGLLSKAMPSIVISRLSASALTRWPA
ncbi:MAG: hypothetical protein AAGB25_09690, partial [Pseudomonadota bacterium]